MLPPSAELIMISGWGTSPWARVTLMSTLRSDCSIEFGKDARFLVVGFIQRLRPLRGSRGKWDHRLVINPGWEAHVAAAHEPWIGRFPPHHIWKKPEEPVGLLCLDMRDYPIKSVHLRSMHKSSRCVYILIRRAQEAALLLPVGPAYKTCTRIGVFVSDNSTWCLLKSCLTLLH